METTVEQTESITCMAKAKPKRQSKPPARRKTTPSRPLITKRSTLPKPKRRR